MAVKLTDRDQEMIRLIDTQVSQLIDKNAPDHLIVNTLIDWIPDAKCLMNSTCEKQLDLYCKEYFNFNYFLQLIAHL
ncbi:hypothetical protein SDB96_15415 [Legionella pneumophila serogroup 1]|uniref:hypothetical protein n=1 Tax=Legionella pneumophila TaxID=446 RepID=UPI0039C33B6F|nr:hypothetical protein [Legionella pneumophila subsp. pneumophila]